MLLDVRELEMYFRKLFKNGGIEVEYEHYKNA